MNGPTNTTNPGRVVHSEMTFQCKTVKMNGPTNTTNPDRVVHSDDDDNYVSNLFLSYRVGNVMFGRWELTDAGCALFQNPSALRIRDWNENIGERSKYSEEKYAISLFQLEIRRQLQGEEIPQSTTTPSNTTGERPEIGFFARFFAQEYANIDLYAKGMEKEFDKAYKRASRVLLSKYFLQRDIEPMLKNLLCRGMGGQFTTMRCIDEWFIDRQKTGNIQNE